VACVEAHRGLAVGEAVTLAGLGRGKHSSYGTAQRTISSTTTTSKGGGKAPAKIHTSRSSSVANTTSQRPRAHFHTRYVPSQHNPPDAPSRGVLNLPLLPPIPLIRPYPTLRSRRTKPAVWRRHFETALSSTSGAVTQASVPSAAGSSREPTRNSSLPQPPATTPNRNRLQAALARDASPFRLPHPDTPRASRNARLPSQGPPPPMAAPSHNTHHTFERGLGEALLAHGPRLGTLHPHFVRVRVPRLPHMGDPKGLPEAERAPVSQDTIHLL